VNGAGHRQACSAVFTCFGIRSLPSHFVLDRLNKGPKAFHRFRADAADALQVINTGEGAGLFAVFHDAAGQQFADVGQGDELVPVGRDKYVTFLWSSSRKT
jgi:hypothetical protein